MSLNVQRIGQGSDHVSCTVGEGPLWHAADDAWYWVDIPAKLIWRLDAGRGALRHWRAGEMVACMALKRSGGLIAAMETGIFDIVLRDDGTVGAALLAAVPGYVPGMRFNDGRCDRQGRFWSGTMVMDRTLAGPTAEGCLYRYDAARGLSAPVVSDLATQNGLAWSPDGRTMYLSDSHPSRQLIWAFDYDTVDGVPSNQRLFVDMNAYPGRPDGAAVDADGCYWIAGNDAGCLLRFTPGGRLDRKLDLPVSKPSMATFGGPGLDTLLVTSIKPGFTPGDTLAGSVLLVRAPGLRGLAETPFAA
jgi:sugar lactone lactonase YvrE